MWAWGVQALHPVAEAHTPSQLTKAYPWPPHTRHRTEVWEGRDDLRVIQRVPAPTGAHVHNLFPHHPGRITL